MSSKLIAGIIIILILVIASLLYYIFYLAKPATVELASRQVTSKDSAQKASSDVGSELGGIQKDLNDIQSVLPG